MTSPSPTVSELSEGRAEKASDSEETVVTATGTRSSSGASRNVVVDMALGAVAGAAGVWVMDKVGWYMYNREDPHALAQELHARPYGKDVAHAAVEKVARLVGADVPTPQPSAVGIGVHYALGVLPGALYAAARREVPALRAGGGALYGFGLFAVNDEMAAPLLGIAAGPTEYPWQAHVRGLVSHVVLGMVTEGVLSLFDRAR